MKRIITFSLLVFFNAVTAQQSPDAPVVRPDVHIDSVLTKQQVENLFVLAKVWGFLKYHHPEVTKGKSNFDMELFTMLPAVVNTSSEKRNEFLLNWMNSLGDENNNAAAEILSTKEIHLKPALEWLHDKTLFSDAVIGKLDNIYKHRNSSGSNVYIKLMPGVLNPNFDGEEKYPLIKADDDGLKMLALFRYWNIIEYYFPSKYLIKENWDDVLKESVQQFAADRTMLGYKLNCLRLISRIHDTHASISGDKDIGTYFGKKYALAKARLIEGKLIVYAFADDSLSKEDPLQIGDEILTVNNKSIAQCKKEMESFLGTSNESAANRNFANYLLLRGNSDAIDISYNHNNEIKNGQLKLYPMDVYNNVAKKAVTSSPMYKLLSDSIGYITLATIKAASLKTIFKTFENTKGIVIDIRNYPAEFMPFEMAYYLKPSPSPFVKFTNGNINNPGLFTFKYYISNGAKNKNYYKGKIVILVDERTQSQAEYTTMALRTAPGAIVMGSQTAGADGNVSLVPFPGGFGSYISGIGVFYPDGKETQGIGIVPDIEVKPTQAGIKKGIDELLEKAIQYISAGK